MHIVDSGYVRTCSLVYMCIQTFWVNLLLSSSNLKCFNQKRSIYVIKTTILMLNFIMRFNVILSSLGQY